MTTSAPPGASQRSRTLTRWAPSASPLGAMLLTAGVLAAVSLTAPGPLRVLGLLVAAIGFADCRWTLHRPDRLEVRVVLVLAVAHELRRLAIPHRGRHARLPVRRLPRRTTGPAAVLLAGAR